MKRTFGKREDEHANVSRQWSNKTSWVCDGSAGRCVHSILDEAAAVLERPA